jgi:hypothetical protein
MTTLVLSKELTDKIKERLSGLKPEIYWDYSDNLDKDQVNEILENGLLDFENNLYEMNIDNISALEYDYVKSIVDEFEDEIKDDLKEDYSEFDLNDITNELIEYLPPVDMKMDHFTGIELNALIKVYSNYDCTNSFDTIETSEYLSQVFKRVKTGVKKDDFIYEHINGAYGGSLFCFAFKCTLDELLEMKEQIKTGSKVFIPKGTQFGFFSSFQGSGSVFEKTTYRNMYLNIKETGADYNPEYDCIDIIADCEQNYSMDDVYGGIEMDYADIKVI